MSSSAIDAGAAGLAEKDSKYGNLVSASGALFYPLVVESFAASLDTLRTTDCCQDSYLKQHSVFPGTLNVA